VSALIVIGPAAVAWRLALLSFVLGLLALGDYIRRAIIIGKRHHHQPQE
jgi:hypothetical protein